MTAYYRPDDLYVTLLSFDGRTGMASIVHPMRGACEVRLSDLVTD